MTDRVGKKIYVITGATSGIGSCLVKFFAKNNVVFAGYRNEKYVEELNKLSKNVKPFYIDMEKKASIAQAAAYIKSKTDTIDTLINVAGAVVAGAVENLEVDRIRMQFEVNTFSHLDLSQRLLPLIGKNGKIINISSMAGFGVFPFVAPYCASKRALDILFNSLSVEAGVTVVSVKPGVIATPLWGKSINLNKKSIENSADYQKEMKYLVANAKNNETKGLNVEKVRDLIVKIDSLKNPKPSYTIGSDAKFAEIFSKLPQDVINYLIKKGLKIKVSSSK